MPIESRTIEESLMYTIQFAQRAHFLSDAAAHDVLEAIRENKAFVTIPIDLAADGAGDYIVTLNVTSIIAIIQHREGTEGRSGGPPQGERARLSLVN